MKNRNYLPIILSLFVCFLPISACMPTQQNEPAGVQVEGIGELALLIEGHIVPAQWAELSFSSSGLIEEIFFHEGDTVKQGDVIVQLSGQQQLAASLAAAELELLSARQAKDLLQENHDVLKTQAVSDRIALEQMIATAELELDNLIDRDFEIDVERAKANIILLENRLESAENLYEEYEDWSETSLTKADARIQLANALQQLEEGNALLHVLENRDKELEIEKAKAELALLEEQFIQAQQRENDLQDGPLPEELALANQRVNAAQAAVDAAQEALNNLLIIAPIDGKILESNVKVGQISIAGQKAVVLADTSEWLVETNDLTEIDRVGIKIGQKVTITPDAYPALEIIGSVQQISDYFQDNRGDITYKTIIALQPTETALFWGMTVLINFEED